MFLAAARLPPTFVGCYQTRCFINSANRRTAVLGNTSFPASTYAAMIRHCSSTPSRSAGSSLRDSMPCTRIGTPIEFPRKLPLRLFLSFTAIAQCTPCNLRRQDRRPRNPNRTSPTAHRCKGENYCLPGPWRPVTVSLN